MTRLRSWTPEMHEWLSEHYGKTDIHELTRMLNAEFGCDKTEQAVYVKAFKLGLRRPIARGRLKNAERVVRWSSEPEMDEFMRANDNGSIPAIIAKFEERFGFQLTKSQVSLWRSANGRQSKKGRTTAQDWHRRPIGYERDTGKGYVLVKVRENPVKPGSKDNWEMKHVLAWESYHGQKLPKDMCVMFGNGDTKDYSEENLVAVPKAVIGMLNSSREKWESAEELEVLAAKAALKSKTVSVETERPRKCAVCGAEFVPKGRDSRRTRTCPECVAKGLRAHSGRGKAVRCVETGKVYPSFRAAAEEMGASATCISQAARGIIRTSGGFRWEMAG